MHGFYFARLRLSTPLHSRGILDRKDIMDSQQLESAYDRGTFGVSRRTFLKMAAESIKEKPLGGYKLD